MKVVTIISEKIENLIKNLKIKKFHKKKYKIY